MVKNILPVCDVCGISVSDLVEPEVKKKVRLKKANTLTMYGFALTV
ncbi:hypothetical protein [Candidatus Nitrosocosmicus sp. FF01]|jgi:hypothetical protein